MMLTLTARLSWGPWLGWVATQLYVPWSSGPTSGRSSTGPGGRGRGLASAEPWAARSTEGFKHCSRLLMWRVWSTSHPQDLPQGDRVSLAHPLTSLTLHSCACWALLTAELPEASTGSECVWAQPRGRLPVASDLIWALIFPPDLAPGLPSSGRELV